jgi:hypothetical protein
MKLLLVMCMVAFFIGCASDPTWNNMSEADISSWKEMMVDIDSANYLNENKITPKSYAAWKENGITKADEIIAWTVKKFSASEAAAWAKAGYSMDDAVDYRGKGLQPVKANAATAEEKPKSVEEKKVK